MDNPMTLTEAKLMLGLPKESKPLGWALHDPRKDEFLAKYSQADGADLLGWVMTPERAKLFKNQKKAMNAAHKLELDGRVEIVPLFDVGKQIVVGTQHPELDVASANPFRTI